MGLIHTRASKKRDKQQAKLTKAERHQVEQETHAAEDKASEGLPWYRQRTLGAAITTAVKDRKKED